MNISISDWKCCDQYFQYFHGSLRKNIYQELRTEADLEMIGNKRAKEVNSEIFGVWEVHSSLTEQFWPVRNN